MTTGFGICVLSLFTILLWGLWGFFGKIALSKGMSPLSIFGAEAFLGFLCAVCLTVACLVRKQLNPWELPWNLFGLLSGAGLAIGLLLYYLALTSGRATVVVPLTALYPAVAVILSYIFLKERPDTTQWVGIALSIVAVLLILSGPTTNTQVAPEVSP